MYTGLILAAINILIGVAGIFLFLDNPNTLVSYFFAAGASVCWAITEVEVVHLRKK